MRIEYEVRTFEQRYGERCPFCNKTWGDPSPCGDSRADYTIEKSLAALFAGNTGAKCQVCDKDIAVGKKYCVDCGLSVEKYRNRQDRHARVNSVCQRCGTTWEHRADKHPRYCGSTCSNLARVGK